MGRDFGAALTPLTRCLKNALRHGVGAGIAWSLCSRARLADWPRMSRCFGCSPQHRYPYSCCHDTTGSGLFLPCWGLLDEWWPRPLSLHGCLRFLYSFLLLLLRQVVAFTSSCLHMLAPRLPRRSCLARFGRPDRRPQGLGLSPCLCLSVQASLIFVDRVVVAFSVACLMT
jgi:hypothetical protein